MYQPVFIPFATILVKNRVGHCFIFSAPSGCGKSTVIKRLCKMDSNLVTSVSTTTRPKRSDEIEGQHYHFVTEAEFETMAENGEFLEYATVFNHRYGTRREVVNNNLIDGHDVLFDIDWQGARAIKQNKSNVVSFFLIPPSLNALKQRLSHRGQDSHSNIEYRMSKAIDELSHYEEFDYLIVNDVLGDTCDLIFACIQSQRQGERYSIPTFHGIVNEMLEKAN